LSGVGLIEEDKVAQTSDSMLHIGVNDELAAVLEDSDEMKCSRVANCDANVALVVDVHRSTGVITIINALTSEIISQSPTLVGSYAMDVPASQTTDGRVLVVIGDRRATVRMRMADSGALVGQWKGFSAVVYGVVIDVKAGMVMGAYGQSGLSVWSFKIGESGPRKPPVVAADGPPWAMEDPPDTFNHWGAIGSIAFAGDGQVAVSCSHQDEFVLVWDTATGKSTRRLDIDMPDKTIWPRAVASSNSGDWILCAGSVEMLSENAFVWLWGPSNQVFSGRFKRNTKQYGCWAATISSEEQRLHGAILVQRKDNEHETFEWALSGSDSGIIVTATETPEDVESKWTQARQGSRELLLQGTDGRSKLLVRKAAVDGVPRCTCETAAMFDLDISSSSTWSETPAQSDAPASTSPKVAVGLGDGTVHFLELHSEEG
jgi:WD40 repeat protein